MRSDSAPSPSSSELARGLLESWEHLTASERRELHELIEATREREERDAGLLDFIPRIAPRYERPAHLAAVARLFERAEHEPVFACVSVPPRHGKTECVLAAIAWWLARHPEDSLGYVSYAASFAESKSLRARDFATAAGVAHHPQRSTLAEWRTEQGGGLLATGIGGPLTGQGVRLAIVDDPVKNREEAESALIRQRTWDWFTSTLWTRIEPGGSCIVVHTRWHEDDLIGRLARGEMGDAARWEIVNLPAVDDAGDALWPSRWPLAELAKKRAANEYDWHSLFMGAPRARGGEVFRAPARYTSPDLQGARIVLAVDPAGTESTRADWTIGVALAMSGSGVTQRADVIDVLRLQREPGDVARELLAWQRKHGNAPLHIETSRDGKAIGKALRSMQPGLRLADLAPRGDKFVRAQPVATAWNEGRVRVPSSSAGASWLGPFLDCVCRFTGVSDRHDVDVDALAYAWTAGAAGGLRQFNR